MLISKDEIAAKIFLIRGKRVMLDRDLARLYGVETKVFNQAVRRNIERFPEDFMFQLNHEEEKYLRSHFVTLEKGRGRHSKYPPYVFTDYGILMLSNALKSQRAMKVSIQIIRTFVKMRELLFNHVGLAKKIEAMERRYDKQFAIVFKTIKELIRQDKTESKKIGFHGS